MDSHSLPITEIHASFLEAYCANRPVVLSAPTGSGKSTQVPRYCLEALGDASGRILVLQPRRLAARMLAERVAFECGSPLGGLVGFQTRYERACSAETRILFITEGILPRLLSGDSKLSGISAIIFDEFHERSLDVELGLSMAVQCRKTTRPDLRLVVMSATLSTDELLAFIPDSIALKAEGRLFPVEISYLEPPIQLNTFTNAAKALLKIIRSGQPGDVLIFMPGGYEIRKTEEECRRVVGSAEKLEYLPLYGDLPPEAQRAVMAPCAHRKVIIATNIAETSLTIPGVRHVIDSGQVRMSRYDSVRGIDMLETRPISRDSADQRCGRAGREAPGTCHRLWMAQEQSVKPSHSIPEILRVDLAEAVLAVTSYGYDAPGDFPWFCRPPEKALNEAEQLLVRLGIKSGVGQGLTDIGRLILPIPAHPRLSLLMVLGAQTGCFRQTAMAAALLSGRSILLRSNIEAARERRQESHRKSHHSTVIQSDFLVQMDLLTQAHEAKFAPDYCEKIGVHGGAAREAWKAYEDLLRIGTRLNCQEDTSEEQGDIPFLKAIMRAFSDRLAKRKDAGTLLCDLQNGRHGELAKDSTVRDQALFVAAEIRENNGLATAGNKTILGLCSGIEEAWLWEAFPDDLLDEDEVVWDEKRQQVIRKMTISCLGLTLDESVRQDPDEQKAAEILANLLDNDKLSYNPWNEDAESMVQRIAWLKHTMPEADLPDFNAETRSEIHKILATGTRSLKQLKEHDCLTAIKTFLGYDNVRFVDANAPAVLHLPNGRKMKISYDIPGQPPKGKAKIQDIYDMTRTPKVAGGRIPILIDILAPNFRTVQITDDLESFWSVQYPKIRTQLSRRYPKHIWR